MEEGIRKLLLSRVVLPSLDPIVARHGEQIVLSCPLDSTMHLIAQRSEELVEDLLLLLRRVWAKRLRGFLSKVPDAPYVHAVMSDLSEEEVVHRIHQSVLHRIPVW